jgi:hypothetical protein
MRAAVAAVALLGSLGGVARAEEIPQIAKDLGPPTVMAGFTWGIRMPWQIVGVGLQANVEVGPLVNVWGEYLYGLGTDFDSGANHLLQLWAGFPLIRTTGTTKQNVVLSQSQSGDTVTTRYVPMQLVSHDRLIVEGGLVFGSTTFEGTKAADANPMLVTLGAGIRYLFFWAPEFTNGRRARNHTAVWLHALAGPIGVPDPAGKGGAVLRKGFGSDGVPVADALPIGGAFGFQMPMWPTPSSPWTANSATGRASTPG